MALSFKNIFGNKGTSPNQGSQIVGTTIGGDVIVASNMNWKMEGITDAGTSKGDQNAFRAGFTSCFARVRNSQELDKDLQDKMKVQLNTEKIGLEGDLATEKGKLEVAQARLESAKSAVTAKQRELANAQSGIVNGEKTLRLNFLIGVGIIAMLTIYLFIFYSSTAFSAFFRDFDAGDSLTEAMFDGNAIIDAFKGSFFEGCFILFMPVIFLGLGYVAHGFSTTDKGMVLYVKTVLLYLLTFAFDCLLAYKISQAFYEIERAITLTEMPPFSIRLAFTNNDFWIVIFCGFVSYVIWGLVFSHVMNCYDKLTNNKYELENLNLELESLQVSAAQSQCEVSKIEQSINQLTADIKKKEHELNTHVRYDYQRIKQSLADYFKGWTSFYALAGMDTAPLQIIYDQEMETVNGWMNNKNTITDNN